MGKSATSSQKTKWWDARATSAMNPPPSVRWRVWPLLDQPGWGVAVLLAMALAGLAAQWATGRLQLGLLVSIVLMAAVWRFFLPTSFELDRNGIDQRRFSRRRLVPWKTIRRQERCQAGVLLLPYADNCPMDRLRGLFLPWGEYRGEVLAHVEFHLKGEGRG